MRKLIAIAAVIALALGVPVTGQTPASAHNRAEFHGPDYARTTKYHYGIIVCDKSPNDHHYTYVWVYFGDGKWRGEKDGPDRECDTQWWPKPYYYFYVCEEGKGCKGPYKS